MAYLPAPFLVQFSEAPVDCAPLPTLVVDAATGLLRRSNAVTPFIDEVACKIEQGRRHGTRSSRDSLRQLETLITKVQHDPVDPDFVRAALPEFYARLATVLTEASSDQPDPDMARVADRSALKH